MSVDLTKGATVELVKTLSDDLRTRDDNTKYSSAGAAMRDKANVDGYYENLVSGGTEQLLSSVFEEDNEPYLFRTSGGSLDIGDREEDTIAGGTIAWNQLAKPNTVPSNTDGLTYTYTDESSFIINGTATQTSSRSGWFNLAENGGFAGKVGHKILLIPKIIGGSYTGEGVGFQMFASSIKDANTPQIKTAILHNTNQCRVFIVVYNGTVCTNLKITLNCFDLTQMFGSTIADYIYSLEQANAGAGVAWFKKLFPKSYYAYDAGTLKSVEGLQSHDMRGFNIIDMSNMRQGSYVNPEATGNVCTDDFVKVVPNSTYYWHDTFVYSGTARYVTFYDAAKVKIGTDFTKYNDIKNFTFTTPANAQYIKIYMYNGNGLTIDRISNIDLTVNLSWDGERDGEYEPYVKHSYPLDDSLTLRGIPKLDANNKLYYDGDVYEADGTVTRKYGIVTLNGSEEWHNPDSSSHCWMTFSDAMRSSNSGLNYTQMMFATVKVATSSWGFGTVTEPTVSGWGGSASGSDNYLYFAAPNVEDTPTAIKTYLTQHPVTIVYLRTTPTTEEAEPYQTPQIVDDFGTEEYVTDSIVPVGHVTKYMPNLKAKLEMAPDSPSDNGDYIVRHTNGLNEYVPLVIPTELPAMPTGSDGTYVLKATVTNGTAVLSWEAE